MNWRIHISTYILFSFLVIGCNNKSAVEFEEKQRLENWYDKVISSRDSILANESFYRKESKTWLNNPIVKENKLFLGKAHYVTAKIESWTDNDSLARIHFETSIPLLEVSEKENAVQLIDAHYNIAFFEIKNGYLQTSNVAMAKSVYYADKYISSDTVLQKMALRTYADYGGLNRALENYEIAISNLNKAIPLSIKLQKTYYTIKCFAELGSVYANQKKYDLAEKNLLKAEDLANEYSTSQRFVVNHLAELYYKKKEFEKAKFYLDKEMQLVPISDSLMHCINYSGVFLGMKQTQNAKVHIDYLLRIYNGLNESDKALAAENIANYYIQTHDGVNAERFLNETLEHLQSNYSSEKALFSEDLAKKYELKEKEDKINLLYQDKETISSKLNQRNYWILFFIVFVLALIGFIGIVVLKQKNKKIIYESKLSQMEDTLLRSQMEPHFVFNAMSSLQSLILDNRTEESANYLSKFARLLRLSLEHSRKKYVPYLEEKEAIDNYLQLQILRFGELFTYTIDENLSENFDFSIPPLMIQPFIENTIYHGFSNIDYQGKLEISFELNDQLLTCRIKDNGIGLNAKSNHPVKNKSSLSTLITKERLQVLTNQKNIDNLLSIQPNDNNEKGTIVIIKLPIILD